MDTPAPLPSMSTTTHGKPYQQYQLFVSKQNSLSEEKYTRNSKPHMVHVVVKNSPFVVSLNAAPSSSRGPSYPSPFASSSSSPFDFLSKYCSNGELDLGKLTFDCKLLYDTDNGVEKEVDYVENKPFMFKGTHMPACSLPPPHMLAAFCLLH